MWLAFALACREPSSPPGAVDADGDGAVAAVDCDDADPGRYPGAPEVWYDGIDQACDGGADDDQDGDGSPVGVDCDDLDPGRSPDMPEVWYDGIDQACDGGDDHDQDGDGFPRPGAPAGDARDCDDTDPTVNPGAVLNADLAALGVPGVVVEPAAIPYSQSEVIRVSDPLVVVQHHATVAWGADGGWASAWQVGELGAHPIGALRSFTDAVPRGLAAALEDPPMVAAKPDIEAWAGGYVVAWEAASGNTVWLRGYDLAGQPVTEPVLAYTGNTCEAPDVALFDDGSGWLVWNETGGTSGEGEHVLLRFDADLQPVGDRVVVAAAGWTVAEVAVRSDGGMVVVATRKLPQVQDYLEVYGKVYGADGCESEFRADQAESNAPSRPTLAIHADGRFAVTWRAKVSAGVGAGAYGRFFDPVGRALTDSFALSREGEDANRSVVAFWGDRAVFSWEGDVDLDPVLPRKDVSTWIWSLPDAAPIGARFLQNEPSLVSAERPAVSIRASEDGSARLITTWEQVGPDTRVVARITELTP